MAAGARVAELRGSAGLLLKAAGLRHVLRRHAKRPHHDARRCLRGACSVAVWPRGSGARYWLGGVRHRFR
eukprot:4669015-Pyramimonas_sp.AAC.1